MTTWRAARDTDVTRLWPAIRTLNFITSIEQLQAFHREAPWRIRVSESGDAMVVTAWRAHLPILAIRGAWAAPHRVGALVGEARRVALAQGFASVVSHLIPVSAAADYIGAGMAELESLVALQGCCRPHIAKAGTDIRMRRAVHDDIAAMEALDAECFDDFWRYGEPELAAAMARERVMLATRDGEIIGYSTAAIHGVNCTVGRLAVHPSARRAGVGRALVLDASAWAISKDASLLTLCTQTSNEASRALYRSLALIEVEEPYTLLVLDVG